MFHNSSLRILDEFLRERANKRMKIATKILTMAASISCSFSVKQIYPRTTIPFVNAKMAFHGRIINGSLYSNSYIVRHPE